MDLYSIFLSIFLLGVLDGTLDLSSEQVKKLRILSFSMSAFCKNQFAPSAEKWPHVWGTELAWRLFRTISSDDQRAQHVTVNARASLSITVTESR